MLSFFIINACVVNRRQLDMFFFVFIAVAMVTGFIGIYQLVMKIVDMTWVDVDLFGAIQLRTFASFANPNVFGTYLLLTVPLSAVMIIYAKSIFLKLAALGVTGLLLYNLVMTYSRGCYLALAVAALFFILLIGKRIMVFVMAGLLTLPVTLPLMIPFIPQNVLNRILSITNLSDSSTSYRLSIWQATLRILQDFWAVGLGQGIEAYNKLYPYYGFNAVVAPHSHNLFLQIFVETGILGLLVFLGLLAAFFRTMASYLRKERDWRKKAVAMAMMSGVVGFLFQGIFDYVFYNNRVMLIFYIYLALGTVLARIGSKEAEIVAKKEGERFVSGYES
jgi:putative inorganic carbon (HCO3(-)) transporter